MLQEMSVESWWSPPGYQSVKQSQLVTGWNKHTHQQSLLIQTSQFFFFLQFFWGVGCSLTVWLLSAFPMNTNSEIHDNKINNKQINFKKHFLCTIFFPSDAIAQIPMCLSYLKERKKERKKERRKKERKKEPPKKKNQYDTWLTFPVGIQYTVPLLLTKNKQKK